MDLNQSFQININEVINKMEKLSINDQNETEKTMSHYLQQMQEYNRQINRLKLNKIVLLEKFNNSKYQMDNRMAVQLTSEAINLLDNILLNVFMSKLKIAEPAQVDEFIDATENLKKKNYNLIQTLAQTERVLERILESKNKPQYSNSTITNEPHNKKEFSTDVLLDRFFNIFSN